MDDATDDDDEDDGYDRPRGGRGGRGGGRRRGGGGRGGEDEEEEEEQVKPIPEGSETESWQALVQNLFDGQGLMTCGRLARAISVALSHHAALACGGSVTVRAGHSTVAPPPRLTATRAPPPLYWRSASSPAPGSHATSYTTHLQHFTSLFSASSSATASHATSHTRD